MLLGVIAAGQLWAAAGVIVVAFGLIASGSYRGIRNWNSDTRRLVKESVDAGVELIGTQLSALKEQQNALAVQVDDARTRVARIEGHLGIGNS